MRILLGVIFCAALASAQTAVPDEITREPHHRLLLQNEQVRVFEVTLRPAERLFVKHQYNFLVVTLQDCEMVMWNEGESEIASFRFNQGDVRFFYSGSARGMRNDHTGMYRNITVEFLNPKVTTFGYQANTGKWEYGGSAIGPPVDPNKKFHSTLKLGVVDASDVQLLQRDILEPPDKGTLELLIPVTDLDVTRGSDLHVRKRPGDAWWIGDGRKADLMNTSPDPARFALVELRPAGN
ncbi:MAG TPA: hypothetical protein VIW67_25190 [Terriglobales bacterium]